MKNNWEKFDVAVIGGGAAGMMAAVWASQNGARVVLIEKNKTLGKKLLMTGNGRCNITHNCESTREFVEKLGKNGKFLFSSFSAFGSQETMKFFANSGLALKTEKDGRVFPKSDKAQDVLNALEKKLKNNKVKILFDQTVLGFETNGKKIECMETKSGKICAHNFILATGGKSYPNTGSAGDGYNWAKEIGHTIIDPLPALVPVKIREDWIKDLQGISMKNIGISLIVKDKKINAGSGQIIFTHFGLSGPAIINASRVISQHLQNDLVFLELDLMPTLNIFQLEEKLKNDFEKNPKINLRNYIGKYLPQKLADKLLGLSEIGVDKKISYVSKIERMRLMRIMKNMRLTVDSLLDFQQAMLTSGGVNLKEIDPKTMRSKLFANLFFSGEILDLDGPTGGYNLQIAWTTGRAAGWAASEK